MIAYVTFAIKLIEFYPIFADPKIEEYLNNVIVQDNDGFYVKEYFSPSPKSLSFQSSSLDDQISEVNYNYNDDFFGANNDYNVVNNANLLRDIESLIQNMEKKQTRNNNETTMLDNIDSILSNIKLNESRPLSPQSNQSAEPIRMKSPIMAPRATTVGSNKHESPSTHDIMEDIRHFVTNNIQDIVPDLVSQVELEITRDLADRYESTNVDDVDTSDDVVEPIFNVDEFIAAVSGNLSSAQLNSKGHDESEHNHSSKEEFQQINDVAGNHHKSDADDENDGESGDLQAFLFARHDAEYDELLAHHHEPRQQLVDDASHDSISVDEQRTLVEGETTSVDVEQLQIANAEDHTGVNEKLNNDANLKLQVDDVESTNSTEAATSQNQQFESLKYKSSFNLKISRQPKVKRRTKSEKDFKKRNSLILENMLMGKVKENAEAEPVSDVGSNSLSQNLDSAGSAAAAVSQTQAESNEINQESHETESDVNPNLISKSTSSTHTVNEEREFMSENVATAAAAVVVVEESTQVSKSTVARSEESETISSAVNQTHSDNQIPASSPSPMMNDDVNGESTENAGGSSPTLNPQSHTGISSNVSENGDLSTKTSPPAQQNLSELVEDTQRLIKQMKDEISAIYISDDDDENSMGSEETEYTDEWIDGDYIEEESEYEEWSGGEEYEEEIEDEQDELEGEAEEDEDDEEFEEASNFAPDERRNPIIKIFNVDDRAESGQTNNHDDSDTPATPLAGNSNDETLSNVADEIDDIVIIGVTPDTIVVVVDNSERAEIESIVHGKLEIQTSSSSQTNLSNELALSSENISRSSSRSSNLNNSFDESNANQIDNSNQSENEAADYRRVASSTPRNSIKEIVSEAINDVISAATRAENIDDTTEIKSGHPPSLSLMASSSSSLTEQQNSAINSSSMNNSANIATEIIAKVSPRQSDEIAAAAAVDDSITSGNVLNDENEIIDVIRRSDENIVDTADSSEANRRIVEILDDEKMNEASTDVVAAVGLAVVESSSLDQASANGKHDEQNDLHPNQAKSNNNDSTPPHVSEQTTVANNDGSDQSLMSTPTAVLSASTSEKVESNDAAKPVTTTGAKSKIPSKTKTVVKKKTSTTKDASADQSSTKISQSSSTSPDKIKESAKKSDDPKNSSPASSSDKNSKQPQNPPNQRKSSFDSTNARKKSITTPFGLLASSNVKNLQNQFLNKSTPATATAAASKLQPTKPKPSKLVPPKILTRDQAITTITNKLSKTMPKASTNSKSSSSSDQSSSSKSESQPQQQQQRDHSKDEIPKKKYMEHCFSDEYATSSDEDDDNDGVDEMKSEQVDESAKQTRSFYIKKQDSTEFEDETSDVSESLKLFQLSGE